MKANDEEMAALQATADAARARWERVKAEPPPPAPLGSLVQAQMPEAPRMPRAPRPRWCAMGCGAEAPIGATYCLACRPIAARERRRVALADAAASLPNVPHWFRLGAPLFTEMLGADAIEAGRAALTSARVLITGPAGAGKTSLAVAMARWILDEAIADDATPEAFERGARLRFALADTMAYVRADAPLGEEPAQLRAWRLASVLVIDDLGGEARVHNSPVGALFKARYERGESMTTIVTSGYGEPELLERYGDGVFRRAVRESFVISLGTPDPQGDPRP